MDNFDLVVIGAGPGGYPAAIRAAQLGAKAALVEREELGGTCLNWGCIPTKTLLASSELFWQVTHAHEFGVQSAEATYDYSALARRKDLVVSKLRGGVGMLLKANGVTVLTGQAALDGRGKVIVTAKDGAATPIGAKKVILATGSTSAMPGFIPRHPRVVESKAFLDLKALPKSVLVLGGGIIGCEFACMLGQLGVQTTVVEMLEDILFILDADVRREVRRHMEKTLNIRVLTGQPLSDIKADDRGVRGKFGAEELSAEMLLVAVGRKPVTDGLKLETAGVTVNKGGFIEVDEFGGTKAAGIYAVGDVNGGIQLAHNATSQGIVAAENALSKTRRRFEKVVPSCIFTSPEVGTAGLSEQDAAAQKRPVVSGKFMFAALGKALAAGHTGGFVKWIADPGTDQVLGAAAVGAHATELIAVAATAIRAELTVKELGRTIFAHPTFSESWMEAAHALHGEAIHMVNKRRA